MLTSNPSARQSRHDRQVLQVACDAVGMSVAGVETCSTDPEPIGTVIRVEKVWAAGRLVGGGGTVLCEYYPTPRHADPGGCENLAYHFLPEYRRAEIQAVIEAT